jgi:hypothetical protein
MFLCLRFVVIPLLDRFSSRPSQKKSLAAQETNHTQSRYAKRRHQSPSQAQPRARNAALSITLSRSVSQCKYTVHEFNLHMQF